MAKITFKNSTLVEELTFPSVPPIGAKITVNKDGDNNYEATIEGVEYEFDYRSRTFSYTPQVHIRCSTPLRIQPKKET